MEALVHALADRLPPDSVRVKERVRGLERCGQEWRVGLDGDSGLLADSIILATEAHQASRLLRYVDPGLGHLLADIPYASSATVSLGYARADVRHPLDGFGFVVPRVERRRLLACTFSSVKYPGRAPDGFVLLRAFLGGALDEGVLAADDEALVRAAREELASTLGISAAPVLTRLWRHPASMPQYLVGHLARIEAIDRALARHRGLALAGAAYRGVGIADSVHSGETAAQRLLAPGPT
jgi:oxygen-dependent protoporphyrinogen oxidase